jgi:hypothetical protein
MVIGLVSVRNSVEVYAPGSPVPLAEAASCAGLANRVLIPQIEQERAADQLEPKLLADQQVRDEGQAEGGDAAVQRVGAGGAQARDQTRGATIRQRAADAQHADRPDGRGDGESEQNAF